MKRRIIFRWLKVIILIYCTIGIALYYLQDHILFHPSPVEKKFQYDFLSNATTELTIHYDKETQLNVVEFKPQNDTVTKGVVLYFHGNRNNISWYKKYASNFTNKNYEVWMIDYPGFGKSTGTFTEQRLYEYALQLYKLARSKYKPANIIIYGKSLGTCFATQLASIRDCKYLILETPYYSMTSLATHYLPIYPVSRMLHYHFPNDEYIKNVTAPILIFHGTDDGVVPYSNAEKLKLLLKPSDKFITIVGGSHNDLNDYPLFHETLDSLLEK
ncbi:MAG: alpha/beta hydrolase [Bacteroidetes bacterium]|nr:alpha/beta hydrolase [Bacteroidota bacterium]